MKESKKLGAALEHARALVLALKESGMDEIIYPNTAREYGTIVESIAENLQYRMEVAEFEEYERGKEELAKLKEERWKR